LGSCSNTSRPAPAISPRASARPAPPRHDRATRGVDEERGLLHQAKFARADLMARFRLERGMQRHEVGLGEQRVERHIVDAGLPLLARGLAPRPPIEHAHAKTARAPRHRLAD